MTVRIGELAIDCSDPMLAAQFWCEALGYRITDQDETGVAIAGDSAAPTILLFVTSDSKLHKNRIHLDVCPVDTSQEEEVRRLEGLGARRLDIGQGDVSWVVMEDPVGNEFCVMSNTLPPEPEPFHHLDDS
ncbi:MAG: VOC family protein [Actinobacteria bacterium]|nr:VOC family protein [Actinomycetota bacterium]